MGSGSTETEVVYRSMDVVALALIEDRLRLAGLEPYRLGRVEPALLGAGMAALEQLIAVPQAHASAARALIEQTEQLAQDPSQQAELEAEALDAIPEPGLLGPHAAAHAQVDTRIVAAALGLMILLLVLAAIAMR